MQLTNSSNKDLTQDVFDPRQSARTASDCFYAPAKNISRFLSSGLDVSTRFQQNAMLKADYTWRVSVFLRRFDRPK